MWKHPEQYGLFSVFCIIHWLLKLFYLHIYRYAYLEFDDEAAVEKAMTEMQGAEIDGWNIMLDYVGEKSKNQRNSTGGKQLNFPQLSSPRFHVVVQL